MGPDHPPRPTYAGIMGRARRLPLGNIHLGRRRDEEGKICLGYPRMGLADVRIALSGKQEDVVLWFKQTKIRTIEGEE